MIRASAALDLARSIMSPLVPELDLTDHLIELAATMIMNAVEADELKQRLEKLESSDPMRADEEAYDKRHKGVRNSWSGD